MNKKKEKKKKKKKRGNYFKKCLEIDDEGEKKKQIDY